jgi:aryl-alcohol dehydrogenase-like predicted oxidoreductase
MFRQKPAETFFKKASENNVGIIVRVPLASGLLTGKFGPDTLFSESDHRNFNREGKFFDKGETFSGVPYDIGLKAVEELKKIFGQKNLAQYALKWVLSNKYISCVIPGASKVEQLESNSNAPDLPLLSEDKMRRVEEIYNEYIEEHVQHMW